MSPNLGHYISQARNKQHSKEIRRFPGNIHGTQANFVLEQVLILMASNLNVLKTCLNIIITSQNFIYQGIMWVNALRIDINIYVYNSC